MRHSDKRYFKYADNDTPLGAGMTYLETQDGYAIRQITTNGSQDISSNLLFPPWGLCLADGYVDYDILGDAIEEISPSEFEAIWKICLSRHASEWQTSKIAYPKETPVSGWIEIFFPQGVIVNLGDGTLGVADYAACRSSAKAEWMYTGHKITAIVVGYDETNHWLLLDHPQVYEEIIVDHRVKY